MKKVIYYFDYNYTIYRNQRLASLWTIYENSVSGIQRIVKELEVPRTITITTSSSSVGKDGKTTYSSSSYQRLENKEEIDSRVNSYLIDPLNIINTYLKQKGVSLYHDEFKAQFRSRRLDKEKPIIDYLDSVNRLLIENINTNIHSFVFEQELELETLIKNNCWIKESYLLNAYFFTLNRFDFEPIGYEYSYSILHGIKTYATSLIKARIIEYFNDLDLLNNIYNAHSRIIIDKLEDHFQKKEARLLQRLENYYSESFDKLEKNITVLARQMELFARSDNLLYHQPSLLNHDIEPVSLLDCADFVSQQVLKNTKVILDHNSSNIPSNIQQLTSNTGFDNYTINTQNTTIEPLENNKKSNVQNVQALYQIATNVKANPTQNIPRIDSSNLIEMIDKIEKIRINDDIMIENNKLHEESKIEKEKINKLIRDAQIKVGKLEFSKVGLKTSKILTAPLSQCPKSVKKPGDTFHLDLSKTVFLNYENVDIGDPLTYLALSKGIIFGYKLYPNYDDYAVLTVYIEMSKNRSANFARANKIAGFEKTPKGYTWHEVEDTAKMQLVPSHIHNPALGGPSHRGGIANLKAQNDQIEKLVEDFISKKEKFGDKF